MDNTFPFIQSSIKAPVVVPQVVKKDELFKDNQYIRDERLQKAFKRDEEFRKTDYKPAMDGKSKFRYPENSHDLIKFERYKDLNKEELKDKFIYEIYNEVTDKVIDKIPKDEIERIQGSFHTDEASTTKQVAYKPVYSSIDISTNKYQFNNIILDGKYEPYQGNYVHSYKK
jgi:hypothetical protein